MLRKKFLTSKYLVIGDKKWLTAVSNIKCKIIKTNKGLFVKDRSSKGTWATKLGRKARHLMSMMLRFPFPPSYQFYVWLSKQQIDKASKDNSDRFLKNFAVTLMISLPGQEEPFQEDGACGSGLERGRL